MKFRLLTNNSDTLVGMRLAGIEGEKVDSAQEAITALEKAVSDKEIGIIMINKSLASLIEKTLLEIKKNSSTLIVEIPDKDAEDDGTDGITKYVANAIGIKI